MTSLRVFLLGVFLLTSPVALYAASRTSSKTAAIARQVFEEFAPTGLGVALVQNGELVFSGGYGFRRLGQPAKIDTDTLFPIASLTKGFTAAALAVLVDEGQLDWDDRVIDHFPEFRMADPWVTREFTIRDLLTHRSGLPEGAGDLLFWPDGKATRAEVVQALRYLEPTSSFRTEYAYDNLLYIVAGEVVGAVAGTAWEDFVESRLLAPLGMNDCSALASRVSRDANRATQHGRVGGFGDPTPLPDDPDEPTSAAGSIVCSVSSMTRWMRFFLDKGLTAEGERLISEQQMAELLTPVTLMRTGGYIRERGRTHFSAYALGWEVSDFHGYFLAEHSGAGIGTTAYIALVPELDAAVIALSNDFTYATGMFVMQTIDSLIRDEPHDWIGETVRITARMKELAAENSEEALSGVSGTGELELETYAAVYQDPWYGNVVVEFEADTLKIDMTRSKALTGELIRLNGERFLAKWADRTLNADAYVVFELSADGSVSGMKMSAVSPYTDFSFDFHDLDLVRLESVREPE